MAWHVKGAAGVPESIVWVLEEVAPGTAVAELELGLAGSALALGYRRLAGKVLSAG